jgi:hypothetical protein
MNNLFLSTSVKRDLDLPMVDGGVYTTKWVEGDFNTTPKIKENRF